jgi:zinc transporter ZupT
MDLIIILLGLIGSVFVGGGLVIKLRQDQNTRIIKILLAFSGGFLLSIAFIHFIPELYQHSSLQIGIFILMGFLVQLFLEFFSGGIEHGHTHSHNGAKLPIGLLIALSVHAIIEGIPIGTQFAGLETATSHHHHEDHSLFLGILFHRLPVAIALMTLLTRAKVSRIKVWIYLTLFALTTPIGLFIGMFSGHTVEGFDFDILLAIVVGMLLHISTTIIFETSENHKFNFVKLIAIFIGCGIAFLIH